MGENLAASLGLWIILAGPIASCFRRHRTMVIDTSTTSHFLRFVTFLQWRNSLSTTIPNGMDLEVALILTPSSVCVESPTAAGSYGRTSARPTGRQAMRERSDDRSFFLSQFFYDAFGVAGFILERRSFQGVYGVSWVLFFLLYPSRFPAMSLGRFLSSILPTTHAFFTFFIFTFLSLLCFDVDWRRRFFFPFFPLIPLLSEQWAVSIGFQHIPASERAQSVFYENIFFCIILALACRMGWMRLRGKEAALLPFIVLPILG